MKPARIPARSLLVVLGLVALLGGRGQAQAEEKPTLAVLFMSSRGAPLSGDELVGMTSYLESKLGESGKFNFLPRREIRKKILGYKPAGAGPDMAPEGEVLIILPAISKIGRLCLVTAQLISTRKRLALAGASKKTACDPERLIGAVEDISDQFTQSFPLKEATGKAKPTMEISLIESRGSPLMGDELVGLTDYLAARIVEHGQVRLTMRSIQKEDLDQLFNILNPKGRRKDRAGEKSLQGTWDYSLTTTVSKVGAYCLSTSALNHETVRGTVKTASTKTSCDPDKIIEAIEKISRKLQSSLPKQSE